MRSAEVQRAERAWLTRELTRGRTWLDVAWVALVLLNLENAIRHTRDGDLIQLSVAGGDGVVRIAVSDTGSGFEISLPAPRQL